MAVAKDPTPTKSAPPRRRREEVLETAARVFREKGYESTSIQDIADAVGILKGSLYYYMDSKEDLLYEILKGVHEEALENIKRVGELDGDALQKLRFCVAMPLSTMDCVRKGKMSCSTLATNMPSTTCRKNGPKPRR